MLVQGSFQIFDAVAASRAHPSSDGAFNHLYMPIAPFLKSFVKIDEQFREHRNLWVFKHITYKHLLIVFRWVEN